MNEQRKEWNPFGWYSDEPASHQRPKPTDSLNRFMDNCSPYVSTGREIYDRVTRRYIPWKAGMQPIRQVERKSDDEDIEYKVSEE